MSFGEYVREYGLERVEGILLRYLSDVYKTLVQTVPAWAKNDAVEELVTTFGAVVRQVDASLLDEWERLKNPYELFEPPKEHAELEPQGSLDITKDEKAFTVLVRNEVFRVVRALARADWAEVDATEPFRIEKMMAPFIAGHSAIRVDPEARSPKHLDLTKEETRWRVRQTLLDPEGDHDWISRGRAPRAGRSSRSSGLRPRIQVGFVPKKVNLPIAPKKPSIEVARSRLGGKLDAGPAPAGFAPGRIVSFALPGGRRRAAVVVYAGSDEIHVLLDPIRLRRLQPDELAAQDGPVDDEMTKLAADAQLFGLLMEGQTIRYADDAGALVDGKLIEKCRWGALVGRDDGAVVAVGFRKLWPAPTLHRGGDA
jgi:hypothetical protein